MNARNSYMVLNEVYFWTSTVKDWKNLLESNSYKDLIINTLDDLVSKNMIKVFGFVIMPNHLHLIWELLAKNGKEKPHASFNKKVSHLIVKDLKFDNQGLLSQFEVNQQERKYRIWQRDPLAVLMDSRTKVEQKLDYIHENPLQEKWNLAPKPEDYYWSSARFYETGEHNFGFLTHYMDRF